MRRVLATTLLGLTPLLSQAADSIRVYNWNDYIDPAVLEDFQRDTGIQVEYKTYSTSEEIAALLASDEAIDVAIPPHDLLPQLLQNQRLQELDFQQLPNRQHLDRSLLAKLASKDQGNRYATPYLWTSAGLAVNVPQAEAAYGGPLPESWSILFEPHNSQRLAKCGISLLDAPRELYSNLLNYQGHSLSNATTNRLQRASDALTQLRPNLRYIDSERYIEDLNKGQLCLALAWSGDALGAAAAGQQVRFIIPEEGAALSIDSMVIPVTAKRPELSYRFINYLLQPQVAARITSYTFYPSANASARPYLPEELRDNPALYPDAQTKRRLALLENAPSKMQETLDSQWITVRDGR